LYTVENEVKRLQACPFCRRLGARELVAPRAPVDNDSSPAAEAASAWMSAMPRIWTLYTSCCNSAAVTVSSRDSIIRQYFRNKKIARLWRKYCENIVRLSKKLEILLRNNIAPNCSIVVILLHTAIIG
jgi:hypothetical protein